MRKVLLCLLSVVLAGTLTAQLKPGDLVVTYLDTNNSAGGNATVQIDPNTNTVTSLLTTASTAAATGNWAEMANNNQDVWVAHNVGGTSPAEIWILDQLGGVKARTTMQFTGQTVQFRADAFHFTNDGGLTWSVIGGSPAATNTILKTDLSFGNLDTLSGTTLLNGTSLGHTPTEGGLYATSSQATSPAGAVQVVDSATKTITKTITGLGLCNTIDYHKGNGKAYATEFGIPGNTGAAAGSLFEVDLNAGTVTSLIDGTTAGGLLVDRLNWIEYQSDHSLMLGARNKIFRYDTTSATPGTPAITNTWTFAATRNQAVTGATVYGNRVLTVDSTGGNTSGSTLKCNVSLPLASVTDQYFLAVSVGYRPGVQFANGQWLDLDATHPLFFVSVAGLAPAIFANFSGTLNAQGTAQGEIRLPTVGTTVSLSIYVGGIVLQGTNVVAAESVEQDITLN